MRYAAPGATFEATAENFATGLTGTVGVRIVDNVGGTTVGRSTSGIIEIASGIYAATLTAPSTTGEYTIVWDDGANYASEDLTVTGTPEVTITTIVPPATDTGDTYLDLVDGVLDNRFTDNEANRGRAEKKINERYAKLVGLDDWTFRYVTGAVSVTADTRTLALPSDFQAAIGLWDDQGQKITYIRPDAFNNYYLSDTTTGNPCHFTIRSGVAYVAPTPAASSDDYVLFYRRRAVKMSADDDQPIIPIEYRGILVHGARADLLLHNQDPSWTDEEQLWQQGIDALRRDYLTDIEGEEIDWPADPTFTTSVWC